MDEQEKQLPPSEPAPETATTSDSGLSSNPATEPAPTISDQEVDDLLAELDTNEQETPVAKDSTEELEPYSEETALSDFDPDEEVADVEPVEEDIKPDAPPVPPNGPSQPDTAPAGPKKNKSILILTGITAILLILLGVSVWWFFLKDAVTTPTPTPTPAPSIAALPTQIPVAQTHLECRFGLCVEVPGEGSNVCSSSFDCETDGAQLTATPTSGEPSPIPTRGANPTSGPTGTTIPTPTTVPTGTITPTATTTPTRTPTPTTFSSGESTVTPTPLATSLPESGTVETTLMITLLSMLFMATGVIAYRKR